ncbi:histidine phosphatase family protein [Nocardia fusca]|uniref:histidine phosphatase family protein n=1 Tax=Nocardia fusca TaxID=941183 RepID=UPI0037CA0ED4
MRTSIFLVRHARSVPPTPTGPSEYQRPLTETGRGRARRLADSRAELGPGVVMSSPYLRAVRTLEPAARQWDLPIHTDQRLREWDSGIEPTPDCGRHYEQSWAHPPGEEHLSKPVVRKRSQPWMAGVNSR